MTSHHKTSSALIALLLLAACMHLDDPKDYQPTSTDAGTGRVCLYRMAPRTTSGAWQDWVLDGQSSGEIRPDRVSCLETHAGHHVVRVSIGPEKLEFFVQKDEQVFVRFDVDAARIHPVLVNRQTVQEDFKRMGWDLDRLDAAVRH